MHVSLQYSSASSTGSIALNLWDFLSHDMKDSVSLLSDASKVPNLCMHVSQCCCSVSVQVIASVTIPYASSDVVFRSFKVMPRAEVRGIPDDIVLATRDCVEELYAHPPLTN